MSSIIAWLQGKKTYFIMFAIIVHAIVVTGWQGGDWSAAFQEILAALGLGAIRAGVTKSGVQ